MLTTMDGTLDRPATGDSGSPMPSPQGFPSASPMQRRPRRPRVPGAMRPPGQASDVTPSIPNLTAGQGMGMPRSGVGGAATPFATPPGAAPTTANLSAPGTAPAAAPAAAPPAAAAPQMPTPPTPPTPPSAPPASGSVPTAGIDPTNDLRSRAVLPQDDANLADARTRLMGADSAVGGYDRVAAIRDAIQQFGGQMPDDVEQGIDVTAGPSEQGALDTLSGQVSGAARKVAGYDRNADVQSIRDQLAQYFGNTDVGMGPDFDPGKDYTGDVNTADASTMNALSRVTGRDRTGLATNLRSGFDQYFGPTDVKAGAAIDAGPSVAGDLSNADRMTMDTAGRLTSTDRTQLASGLRDVFGNYLGPTDVQGGAAIDAGPSRAADLLSANKGAMDAASKVTGTDRTQLASGLRDQFGNYLKPADLSTRGAVDPTASARLNRLSGMTDASAGNLAGVDRVKMAQDLLKQFSDSTNPEYDLALRQATDKAVAAGGARSGQLRTKYGDLALARARDLDLEKRKVMSDALSGSIEDAFRKTGALQGLEGQVAGQESATRGEQRTERGYATDVESQNLAAQRAAKSQALNAGESAADAGIAANRGAYSTAADLASTVSGQEQQRRANLGAERAYTTDIGTGNVQRRLATAEAAAGLGESAADAALNARQGAYNTASNLSSNLSNREQVRRSNLGAERAYTTDVGTGNVQRQLATRAQAAGLGESAADATLGADQNALTAARGVSSELSSRQQVRGANQRADQATKTAIETGNVGRRLATKEAANAGATTQAGQNFGTAADALSALSGLQSATAGREAGRRGELRTERDTATGLAERNAARRAATTEANRTFGSDVASGRAQDLLARTGSASNLFGTLANDAAAQRGEVRGERANQVGMEDQSYQRALTQEQLQQQEESQRQARALALLDAGEAGNPSGVMGALSEAPGSIDPAMIAQLAQVLGRTGVPQAGAAPTATRPRVPVPPAISSLPPDQQMPEY